MRLLTVAAGIAMGALCGAGLSPRSRTIDEGAVLAVPAVDHAIAIDGELEDWNGAGARTGAFVADGRSARPYSDARFLHRDGALYMVLYAADEDIRSAGARHDDPLYLADAFELVFRTRQGEHVLYVSPRGVTTDAAKTSDGKLDFAWESHARVAVDVDGVIDDAHDMDEEWVVEMALPLEALGLRDQTGERVGLSLRRCDVVRTGERRCGAWSGTLELR